MISKMKKAPYIVIEGLSMLNNEILLIYFHFKASTASLPRVQFYIDL